MWNIRQRGRVGPTMIGRLYPDLRDVRLFDFGKRVIQGYIRDDMPLYAAALSFHGLLAIFPFLIFLLGLLSFLQIPGFFDWVIEQANVALPDDAARVVDDVIISIREEDRGGLASFGAVLAFSAASTGVRALMTALNSAYDIVETRAFWKKYLLSLVYTLGLAVLLIIAGGSLILAPRVVDWLSGYIGLSSVFVTVWIWVRFPVVVVIMMMVAALVYYVVPNVKQPFRFITPGATIAVLVWLLASIGFSLLVANIIDYSVTYGSLGGIVALLFYFFITAAVLLLGAEINAGLYRLKMDHAELKDTSGVKE